MKSSPIDLKLKGKAAVFIDWANVYGWTKSLKREVDFIKNVPPIARGA